MKMKKLFFILLLVGILFLNSMMVIYADSILPDFYSMFDGHGSSMLLIDSQSGSIVYANKSASDFYGYSIEQLKSMKITDINTLSPEETSKEMQDAVQKNRNFFVFRHKLASGEIRTVEVYSYPYYFGKKQMLFSIVHDVTEKTQLAERNRAMTNAIQLGAASIIIILIIFSTLLLKNLKKLKEKINEINNLNELRRSFIDADERLIYLKDENLNYIFVNRALENFYAMDSSEIIGFNDFHLSNIEFAELRRTTDIEVLNKQKIILDEVKWKDSVFKTNKFPIKLLNGQYGVGAYIEDITLSYKSKREKDKTLLRNSILVDVFNYDFNTSTDQLDYVLSKALELTESKFGYIYLYDEEKQEFTLNSWSNDVMDECHIVEKLTKYQLEKTGIWGEAVRQRKSIVVNDFELSNPMKKGYPEGHVKLTKFMTIPVIIDNKIVAVVGLANKQEDYDENDVYQISVLMTGVWNYKERLEREKDLTKVNYEMNLNKNQLQLILNSTAEGIYGIDNYGKCTFCNANGLKLLGYSDQKELLGKDMHLLIHHAYKDGTPMSLDECKIYKSLLNGKGTHAEDEVFWRSDGTSINVEYHSYPQYDDGKIYGAVITFLDNSERKKSEEHIRYLSYHDSLTELYNRKFFEDELIRINSKKNLPISIIFGDVNGLKLTNDIFGHAAGDELLKKSAKILQKVCREDDVIARVGGDEFVILLPNIDKAEVIKIIDRIKKEFEKERFTAIRGSISMGHDTKTNMVQDIESVMKNAEERMYKEKTINQKTLNLSYINTIVETLHLDSPREKSHSLNVSMLCKNIGYAMKLSETKVKKVKEAGFLHDIGKIILDKDILNKDGKLTENEKKAISKHPIIGYRILNLFDETLDLADSVLKHHENWDGSGYPKGLKGEEIPLFARIIRVAEVYDAMTNSFNKNPLSTEEALMELKTQSGKTLDPNIVDIFLNMNI